MSANPSPTPSRLVHVQAPYAHEFSAVSIARALLRLADLAGVPVPALRARPRHVQPDPQRPGEFLSVTDYEIAGSGRYVGTVYQAYNPRRGDDLREMVRETERVNASAAIRGDKQPICNVPIESTRHDASEQLAQWLAGRQTRFANWARVLNEYLPAAYLLAHREHVESLFADGCTVGEAFQYALAYLSAPRVCPAGWEEFAPMSSGEASALLRAYGLERLLGDVLGGQPGAGPGDLRELDPEE